MKCTEFKHRIDDYLDGQLSELEQSAYERHVSACSACGQLVRDTRLISDVLSDLPVPEPSADFEQRVFDEVRRRNELNEERRFHFPFAAGFATAAVASLVIWFTSTLLVTQPVVEEPQIISVAMNQTQTVRLMFNAQRDFNEVSLSIGLPENMELDGYPGHRELNWKTSLQRGENVLALPILAIEQGQGVLVARLNYGDKEQTISLLLKTTINGVQHFQLESSQSV